MTTIYSVGESVKFIKSIEFGKGSGKKNIANLMFGKKSSKRIRPASVFYINDTDFGVTDQLSGIILVLDKKGKIKTKIKNINIQSPVSGCSDGSGGFFVSDSTQRLIINFNAKYKFKRIFVFDRNKRITGIAFFENKLFAVDTANHNIVIYGKKGEELIKFGRRGKGKGEFNYPTHIAVDIDTVYVVDALNFRIQMFNHKGDFKGMFGKVGKKGGNFSKPKGIAVDKRKRIFVTDVMFDNVQIFDVKGRFLSYFGSPGNKEGKFWMPFGIMIDKNGLIYVADTYNSRCQVFVITDEEK